MIAWTNIISDKLRDALVPNSLRWQSERTQIYILDDYEESKTRILDDEECKTSSIINNDGDNKYLDSN